MLTNGTINVWQVLQSWDQNRNASGVLGPKYERTHNATVSQATISGLVKTSGFRLKDKNGTLPENGILRSRKKLFKVGRFKCSQTSGGSTMTIDVPGPYDAAFYNTSEIANTLRSANAVTGDMVTVRNAAIANLQQKMSSTRANLPVAAVEGRKTVDMVYQSAKRIVAGIRAIRRGKFIQAATALGMSKPPKFLKATVNGRPIRVKVKDGKTVKADGSQINGDIKFSGTDITSNWLAYRYGWVPLLSDIHGSLTTAYDYARTPDKNLVTLRSMASREYVSSIFTTAYTKPASVNYPSTRARIFNYVRTSSRFKVVARLDSKAASSSAQLGLNNPALVAWELVPFSFVADWFINVGDVLQGLTSYDGYTFVKGVRMDSAYNSLVTYRVEFTRSGSWVLVNSSADALHEYVIDSYHRVPLTAFPSASFHFERNPFEGKVKRALDAVSLLSNLFKR